MTFSALGPTISRCIEPLPARASGSASVFGPDIAFAGKAGEKMLLSALGLSTATAHEAAGKAGALPSFIKPIDSHMRLCGKAFTVRNPAGDNLFLHHAIYAASPGDVLVVDCGQGREYGYWGEVMSVAAQSVRLGGLVITGGVRDVGKLTALRFPVFSGCICIRGTRKNPFGDGALGAPIRIGDVDVNLGDLVLGDQDGVVVLPIAQADSIIAEGRRRDAAEVQIFEQLRAGKTSLEIYDLPEVKG